MIVLDVPQLSPAWFAARAGVLTASVAADIYATRKDGKESAARRDLRVRLALERIAGKPIEDTYSNADMERGRTLEPEARIAYEMRAGVVVSEVGFVLDDARLMGASPDGFVSDVGTVEIKSPRPATHLETIKAQAVPADYIPQVTHTLLVTGRAWVDFVSYCPLLPAPLDLCIVRHHRTTSGMAAHELVARQFLAAVDATERDIRALMR